MTGDRSHNGAAKIHSNCRVCGSSDLLRYLDMGVTPLANAYLKAEQLGLAEPAAEATARGIPTIAEYWSPEVARGAVAEYGRPATITATNVLAHVDDVHEFVQSVELALAPRGIFVVEVPYLIDFIERNEFDTAY